MPDNTIQNAVMKAEEDEYDERHFNRFPFIKIHECAIMAAYAEESEYEMPSSSKPFVVLIDDAIRRFGLICLLLRLRLGKCITGSGSPTI